VNLCNDAGVHAGAPKHDAVAGKSWQVFDVRHRCGTKQADAAIPKIAFIVEGPGIAEIARRVKLGANAEAVAISEVRQRNRHRKRGSAGGIRTGVFSNSGCGSRQIFSVLVEGQPNAGTHWPATIPVGVLYLLGFHVDGSSRRAGVGGGRMPVSLSNHVRGQTDCLTAGELNKMWVFSRSAAHLNEKCAEQKPRPERQSPRQPCSAGNEPAGGEQENCDCNRPPNRRTPGPNPGPETQ
jgi:hypothetical protein